MSFASLLLDGGTGTADGCRAQQYQRETKNGNTRFAFAHSRMATIITHICDPKKLQRNDKNRSIALSSTEEK